MPDKTQIATGRVGHATVNFAWAIDQTVEETGIHERVSFDWAMSGGPFSSGYPKETLLFTWGVLTEVNKKYGHDPVVQFNLGLELKPQLRIRVTEQVNFNWAAEFSGQEIITPNIVTDNPISPSTPNGVLPQHGSGTGIYPKWIRREIKEARGNRVADAHETGGIDEDDIRYAWDLSINIQKSSLATHWSFIKARFGAGKAFYFYDLLNNGFVWDATGVFTTGRYLVRFDNNVIPQVYEQGERFIIEYTLIEVA